jgi:small subunit ribosomal protein S6
MNIYENVLIINSSLTEDELKSTTQKITEQIGKSGGEILKVDNWGKRKLAYELNKQKMAFYVLILFRSPSLAIKELEYFYKVFDPVMKYMIIRLSNKQIEALPKEVIGIPVTSQELSSPSEPEV